MYFVGLDLAWGEKRPTGVAVLDDGGKLVHVSAQTDDASIRKAVEKFVEGPCVVGIDAPLIVENETGNRPAEAALNKDFRAFQSGAHPANKGKPEFANGTRGATRLADALDLDLNPLLGAAPSRARGVPARGVDRAVSARPHAEVQGQEGPRHRAVALRTAAADGFDRGLEARRAVAASRAERRLATTPQLGGERDPQE